MSGHIELTATDTLTFTRQSGSLAQNMRFDWELIEYTGSGGGANEFIVRSRNTVTLTGTSTTATLDTTPTDTSNCVPFITGVLNSTTSNAADRLKACAHINDSGSLVVEVGDAGGTTVVQVVTVEFTGSNWEVYHGTSTGAGDTGSITLNTDSDGAGGTTGDVTSWGTAFIEGSFTSTDQGLDSVACRYQPGSGTTTVDWDFQSGNSTSHKHFVHVVRNADMVVTRYTPTGSAAGDTNVDITSAGLTSLSTAMIIGTCQGSGGGTAYGRNWRNYSLTSTTNARHYCHRSGNTINHAIQIIDFENVDDSGGTDVLLADDVESASEVSSPAIEQEHDLTPTNVESASELSAPALGQEHDLSATNVESASEVSTPALSESHVLLAEDVESSSETSAPAIGQDHQLLADDAESASEASTPDLDQEHSLTAVSVESATEVTAPVLTPVSGTDNLLAEDVESASETTAPSIGQEHDLSANSVESASNVSVPSLTAVAGANNLLAEDVESASEVSAPAVGQEHSLLADDSESASEVTSPNITQLHALGSSDVQSLSEVSEPLLTDVPSGTNALFAEDIEVFPQISQPTLRLVGGGVGGSSAPVYNDDKEVEAIVQAFLEHIA